MEWKSPAGETSVDRADRVELLCLPNQEIIPEECWPEAFWGHVSERQLLIGAEAQRVIYFFRKLEPGISMRCHMPPWGLAFYERDTLLFTVTLCYECGNAYIYSAQSKDLRAFDPAGPNAAKLSAVLKQNLPLCN